MMGAVVKLAVHARGGALREPVRMEFRRAPCLSIIMSPFAACLPHAYSTDHEAAP